MRFEAGLKVELPQGMRIDFEGNYAGLTSDAVSTGGKIQVTVPLQN